jgi:alpha-D-ribose 1-methylphosphonate 5-triphosphate synthase subunit PhnG
MSTQPAETTSLGQVHAASEDRKSMMRTLAMASPADVIKALERLHPLPELRVLRKPEVGLVMIRGRIGGDGAPFNLGEATVTRAVVRLATGETGFSYLLGRQPEKAHAAAVVDAIWQTPGGSARVKSAVLEPLRASQAEKARRKSAETAQTKVDFFTMVRGEDA